MILIDALYINNGGGKVLLDYLVSKVECLKLDVYYLFDERCKKDYLNIPDDKKEYAMATLKFRYNFYSKHRSTFSKVICFGNLPPLRDINCDVYTYFHQPMFLNIPKEFSFKERLKFRLKQGILNYYRLNTNYWFVQNEVIRKGLINKYKLASTNVLLLPFYPNEDLINGSRIHDHNRFIYVSSGAAHKNHERLIQAFCSFFDIYKEGELVLTIADVHTDVIALINEKQRKGYPIKNIGFIGREELIKNYHQAEYLIFPSLEESFGLGIVEAIECGCKVIGADLPYMYQVCEPSIVFDPFKVDSIVEAFSRAIKKEEKDTKQKIFNEIDQLISLLKN